MVCEGASEDNEPIYRPAQVSLPELQSRLDLCMFRGLSCCQEKSLFQDPVFIYLYILYIYLIFIKKIYLIQYSILTEHCIVFFGHFLGRACSLPSPVW